MGVENMIWGLSESRDRLTRSFPFFSYLFFSFLFCSFLFFPECSGASALDEELLTFLSGNSRDSCGHQ